MEKAAIFDTELQRVTIHIADVNLAYRSVEITDPTPTGAQIANAAGFNPDQQVSVLVFLDNGELENLRPNETVDLRNREGRFVVVESDRSYRLTIDGKRFDWPAKIVSGALIRQLGRIGNDKAIYFERHDKPDQVMSDIDSIDLSSNGVEVFQSRGATWVLNVQGVRLELHVPTVIVRDALVLAGFNPDQGWQIFLKLVGEPKQAVELTTEIDLKRPGIEKLRLTPKDVNNGDGGVQCRRDFALLGVDESFLNQHFDLWQTLIEGGRRWLLIHDFPLPNGFSVTSATLAVDIPLTYPGAQIDMFFVNPLLALTNGAALPCTEGRVDILGQSYQQWSRHRGAASAWQSDSDNVVTHLALVESALANEVRL